MSDGVLRLANWVWGLPMLTLVLGTGLYLFVRLRGLPARQLPAALRLLVSRKEASGEGDISPLAALMTSLGSIVGNGNIAGVATAVTAGGPGALFWMWLCGFVGMGTMWAESALSVRYRQQGPDGQFIGGPMFYLRDRLGWRPVAALYALALAVRPLLGSGPAQSNSIAMAMQEQIGWSPWLTCLLVAALTAGAVLGGVRTIARACQVLAPLMSALYLLGAACVLCLCWRALPDAVGLVLRHAFSPVAATGGFLGAGVAQAFRYGVARGVYSNEAGTGTAGIYHASAQTADPVRQGKLAMLGVFIDTFVVCGATGLVVVVTGAWSSGLESSAVTAHAFTTVLGTAGGFVVAASCFLFGLSTIIAGALACEQGAVFIVGTRWRIPYRIFFCVSLMAGAYLSVPMIWAMTDLAVAAAAIPNLLALICLAPEITAMLRGRSAGASSPVFEVTARDCTKAAPTT